MTFDICSIHLCPMPGALVAECGATFCGLCRENWNRLALENGLDPNLCPACSAPLNEREVTIQDSGHISIRIRRHLLPPSDLIPGRTVH